MSTISDYQFILCSTLELCVDVLVQGNYIRKGNYRVGIIVNAADPYKDDDDYPSWVTSDLQALSSLGYELTPIDLVHTTHTHLQDVLQGLDAIFVCGGNTFWLLECMLTSNFKGLIRLHLERGLVYISSSAGSCVTARNIEYVKYADDPELSSNMDYEGLGFVPIAIKPHFAKGGPIPEGYRNIYEYVYEHQGHDPLVTLTDRQAIVGYLDGMMRVVTP